MKSMLIIDGSEILANLFADVFEKRGWLVVICGDRGCAMKRSAESEPYDVVLMGYRLEQTE